MNKSFLVDEEGNQGDGLLGRKSHYGCLIGSNVTDASDSTQAINYGI